MKRKVVFHPIVRVQEYDTESEVFGKRYTLPLFPDNIEEFQNSDSDFLKKTAEHSVDAIDESLFRDDITRLFLLSMYVDDTRFKLIHDALKPFGIRKPLASDYRKIDTSTIVDDQATRRLHQLIRKRYFKRI